MNTKIVWSFSLLPLALIDGLGGSGRIGLRRRRCSALGATIRRGAQVIPAARAEAGNLFPHQRAKNGSVPLEIGEMHDQQGNCHEKHAKRIGHVEPVHGVDGHNGNHAQQQRGEDDFRAVAGFLHDDFPDTVALLGREVAELWNRFARPVHPVLRRGIEREWLIAGSGLCGDEGATSGAGGAAGGNFFAALGAEAGYELPGQRAKFGDAPLVIDCNDKKNTGDDADELAGIPGVNFFNEIDGEKEEPKVEHPREETALLPAFRAGAVPDQFTLARRQVVKFGDGFEGPHGIVSILSVGGKASEHSMWLADVKKLILVFGVSTPLRLVRRPGHQSKQENAPAPRARRPADETDFP